MGGELGTANGIRPMLAHRDPASVEVQIDDLSGTQRWKFVLFSAFSATQCKQPLADMLSLPIPNSVLQLRDVALSVLDDPSAPRNLRNRHPALAPLLDLLQYQPDIHLVNRSSKPFSLSKSIEFIGKEVTVLLVKYADQTEETTPTLRIHAILRAHLETKALYRGRRLAHLAREAPPLG
jgi:hypothetical protein